MNRAEAPCDLRAVLMNIQSLMTKDRPKKPLTPEEELAQLEKACTVQPQKDTGLHITTTTETDPNLLSQQANEFLRGEAIPDKHKEEQVVETVKP